MDRSAIRGQPGTMHNELPVSVRWATVLWAAAIACGVVESALALAATVAQGEPVPWPGVALRFLVYTGATLVLVWFARGHRWARTTLLLALGVVGLSTLVIPIALALPDGAVLAAMGYEAHGPGYLAVRLVHIASVVGAVALTLRSSSHPYFTSNTSVPIH